MGIRKENTSSRVVLMEVTTGKEEETRGGDDE